MAHQWGSLKSDRSVKRSLLANRNYKQPGAVASNAIRAKSNEPWSNSLMLGQIFIWTYASNGAAQM
jgi:hypothetical protein